MLYRAKQFYQMAGIKRSTLRHYQEKGLIRPCRTEQNGYSYYSDRQLVDLMLVRSCRGIDYELEHISSSFNSTLDQQIEGLAAQCGAFEQRIATYQKKLAALQSYSNILKQCSQVGQLVYDPAGKRLNTIFIADALAAAPQDAEAEMAHCSASFPFVHIAARGSVSEIEASQKTSLALGYEYSPSSEAFHPLHPELYQSLAPAPCVLLRLCVPSPLELTKADLLPIYTFADEHHLTLDDTIFTCISGVARQNQKRLYYVSARIYVKRVQETT